MKNITSKYLKDKDNHTTCECGNKTIYEYSWDNHNGDSTSCPLCMVSWQADQIKGLKELVHEISPLSTTRTSALMNEKYAKVAGVSVEDLDEDFDYSKI